MLNKQNFNAIIVCPLHTYKSTTGLQNRDSAGVLCPALQDQSANLQPSISAHRNTAVLRLTQPREKKKERERNLQPAFKGLQESACHAQRKNFLCMDQSPNP